MRKQARAVLCCSARRVCALGRTCAGGGIASRERQLLNPLKATSKKQSIFRFKGEKAKKTVKKHRNQGKSDIIEAMLPIPALFGFFCKPRNCDSSKISGARGRNPEPPAIRQGSHRAATVNA